MQENTELTQRIIQNSVLLIRWLKSMDPSPKLSGPQASALGVIVTAGEITPSDVAKFEEVKRPTIARTLSELAELGLINRSAHPDDARSVIISASKRGYALFHRGRIRRGQPLNVALAKLTKEEFEILRAGNAILTKVLENNLK